MTKPIGTETQAVPEVSTKSILRVAGLRKTFEGGPQGKGAVAEGDRVYAVDGASFDVEVGELFTLLGPSGCGKTTTLRCIAGLERPDGGEISLDGRVIFDYDQRINVPANRRGLGMVFQSYAIWPHMTVHKNVSFPLEILPRDQRPKRREINERVSRALHVTELDTFADRPATKLSGGQQQRLALARALVIQPPVMLLDEPLSNLDAKLRGAMRDELKRLQRETGVTTIYVTHDQVEALALSSRIAVMNRGQVLQVGKPRDIYESPANRFVADFIGTANFVEGTVTGADGESQSIEARGGRLQLSSKLSGSAIATGTNVVASIRPESVELSPADASVSRQNSWPATVLSRDFLGDCVDHVVSVGGLELRVRSNPSQSYPSGTALQVHVPPHKVIILPQN